MSQLHVSDLEKLRDAIESAYKYNKARDEMNAAQHLASNVRYSPLTTVLESELKRADALITELHDESVSPDPVFVSD
jgi:hypothetical protein